MPDFWLKTLAGAWLAALVAAWPAPAWADSSAGLGFDGGIAEAVLIFEGTVAEVASALSAPTRDSPRPIPHTFVTYRVSRVLKGDYSGETITLRFEGGAEGDDTYLLVEGFPLFDAGETGVVFVRGNGASPCPLAGCARGRFRFVDGMTYSETGQEIVDLDGLVTLGPERDIPEADHHDLGSATLARVTEIPLDDAGRAPQPVRRGTHLSREAFLEAVARRVADLTGSPPPPEVSADPREPFAAAPDVETGLAGPRPARGPRFGGGNTMPSDRLEEIYLWLNGGNPVLDARAVERITRMREREAARAERHGDEHRPRHGHDPSHHLSRGRHHR
jgi:hypothetical protein